ncbi:MAG: hypothetical protein JJE52_06450 [Acidimicrobiia bacterium]|nr:hypothetical protein [Acidimicrobiia bacterium]
MGAISRLAGDEATDLVDLLECAGGEFELEADGYLMTGVDHDDDLATRVLSFAHFISAAPIVWHASQCNHDEVQPRPESTARALAKAMRLRLITRIGKPAATLIRLDKRVAGHGESVKVPMAIAPSSPLSAPLLLASFIDMAAAPQAVVAAKRGMTFTYQVARDLRIPKFVVIDGDERDLEHMAELLDPLDVATILFDDPELLEAESRVAIEQLGFATTGRPE